MMNLEEIAKRIKEPRLCGSNDIDQLRQLSDKYPYAQVFSILYLKALSINNDVRFDDELQQHAYKITDRMRLFELVNEKENPVFNSKDEQIEEKSIPVPENIIPELVEINTESINTVEIVSETPILPISEELAITSNAVEPEELENPIEENQIETIPETVEIQEAILNNENQEIAEINNENKEVESVNFEISTFESELEESDFITSEIELPTEFSISFENFINEYEVEEDEDENDEDQFSDEYFSETIISDIEIEEKVVNTEVFVEENNLEFEVLSHAISSNYSVEEQISNDQENSIESNEDLSTIDEPEKEEEKIEIKQEYSNYSLENSVKNTSKKAFSSWLKANQNEPKIEEKEESKNKIDNLVNQFIKEEPSISRPKKEEKTEIEQEKEENKLEKPKTEFFSPIKKARESLDENSLPVSETLAKIFAAQGNFPKAIYAYKQLIVINPEKKIFFANQIEELTKKLNA